MTVSEKTDHMAPRELLRSARFLLKMISRGPVPGKGMHVTRERTYAIAILTSPLHTVSCAVQRGTNMSRNQKL